MAIFTEGVCEKCSGVITVSNVVRGRKMCNPCIAEERRAKRLEYADTSRAKQTDADRDFHRKRLRKYREENPHMAFYTTSRYHAKLHGVYSDLTKEDAIDIYNLPDICAYCGKERTESDGHRAFHNDHIIPLNQGGPNSRWNITRTCNGCNASKSQGSLIDFYERTDSFTSERYEAVVSDMVELSGYSREQIDALLTQSYEFERAHLRERARLESLLETIAA